MADIIFQILTQKKSFYHSFYRFGHGIITVFIYNRTTDRRQSCREI
jgi:hypothetical protein